MLLTALLYINVYIFISLFSFLSSKKTPLIMTQKTLIESMPHTHNLDNPSFVSDLSNMPPSHASINNQYLKTPERKIKYLFKKSSPCEKQKE